jgi:hypothetical protein
MRAYAMNTSNPGTATRIGSWQHPGEVEARIGDLRRAEPRAPEIAPTDDRKGIAGMNGAVVATPSGPYPKAGCWITGEWSEGTDEEAIQGGHRWKRDTRLLPLWLMDRTQNWTDESKKRALDEKLSCFLAAGHITPWRWAEWGIPNVMISLDCLDQDGKWRVIADARYANGSIDSVDPHLPSVADIAAHLGPGTRLAKCDLKMGYHQLKLHPSCWGDVGFMWRGAAYCFTVVTLGTRDAPGVFQSFTRAMGDHIERLFSGVKVFVYLDDLIFLCNDTNPPPLSEIHRILRGAGWVLGLEKCSAEWTTRLEALGVIVDSEVGVITLSDRKQERILALADEVAAGRLPLKRLTHCIGKVASVNEAVRHALTLVRPWMTDLAEALDVHPREVLKISGYAKWQFEDGPVSMSTESMATARTFRREWQRLLSRPLFARRPKWILFVDASATGVGAVLRPVGRGEAGGKLTMHAPLPGELTDSSSLARESFGVLAAVRHEEWRQRLSGAQVDVVTDNVSVAARFPRGYRCGLATSHVLGTVARCLEADIELGRFWWIPRSENGEADAKSRESAPAGLDWTVNPSWYVEWRKCIEESVRPNVDAFASARNKVCPRYFTIEREGGGNFNALSHRWSAADRVWAFPPPGLVRAFLHSWVTSDSRIAYLCLPERQWGAIRNAYVRLAPDPPFIARVEGCDTASMVVVALRK